MHAHTETSAAGLLLSLASALPDPDAPLARRARRLADRIAKDGTSAAAAHEAADLTAALLEAVDASELAEDPDLLDSEFDL